MITIMRDADLCANSFRKKGHERTKVIFHNLSPSYKAKRIYLIYICEPQFRSEPQFHGMYTSLDMMHILAGIPIKQKGFTL